MSFKIVQDKGNSWIIGNDAVKIKCKNFDEILKALDFLKNNEDVAGAPAPSKKNIRRDIVKSILSTSKDPLFVEEILEKIGAKDHKRFGATCLALFREKKLKRIDCGEGYAYFA